MRNHLFLFYLFSVSSLSRGVEIKEGIEEEIEENRVRGGRLVG